MVPPELVVLLRGRRVGVVRRATGDRLSFTYEEEWRDAEGAYPLSHSLPLLALAHGDGPVRAYLEGLLPERKEVLDSWGKRFQVSGGNAYGLLANVGEECPGAVQFVTIERAEKMGGEPAGPLEWLTESEVADRLRNVIQVYGRGAAVKGAGGYFSLAGAQPKIVLYRDGDRWAATTAALPSTHILKPPAMDLDHLAMNEHFCLLLSDELGLPTARSEVLLVEDQVAFVVERFDRIWVAEGQVERIHQEDMCQALGVRPASKYESEGGPGLVQCGQLLIENACEPDVDLPSFIDAVALNWLILGTDAHAKNYALIYNGSRPSLAPLYDVISILPYPQVEYPGKARLAMRIGTEYRAAYVRRRHWEALARSLEVDEAAVVDRVTALLSDVPAALNRVRDRIGATGADDAFGEQLTAMIDAQVPKRLQAMA